MASPSPSPKRASVTSTSPPPKTVQQALDELLDSSDGDAAILRPRGKLASRMQVRGNVEQESASESETDIDSQNEKKDNAKPTTTTTAVSQSEDDDEDEVITKRPRKLQPRRQRSASLETTTQEAPPTPGLFVSPAKSTTAPDSPGLFVSPSKPPQSSAATRASAGDITESDEDLPNSTSLAKNPRFQAMLAKKRKEAKAKEAEEARKRAARLAAQNAADDDMSDDEDDDNITDDEGGRKLTQDGARPIRKASKKALEEMHRETQRLTRSLQLTHEAKVKKKMTKASLFERFNFKPEGVVAAPTTSTAAPAVAKLPDSSRAPTPSSPHKTDLDDGIDKDTPPSSPPVAAEGKEAHSEVAPESESLPLLEQDSDGELPTLEEALAQKKRLDKGKGKAIDAPTVIELQKKPKGISKSKRNLRVKLAVNPATITAPTFGDSDSDDLEILPTRPKTKIDAIFDRRPTTQAQESRSLHHLRKLAQLDDPEKQPTGPSRKNAKQAQAQPSMSAGALQASLLQRARAQAKLERDRHLELLRSKGIHVQTAEEREREMADVEDMVTRARREAEEIMAREREDAKKDRKARKDAGEVDILGWDDSDESGDEDYQGDDGEEVVEEKEVELSGSEDEDGVEDEDEDMNIGEDDDEDEEADAEPAGILFDDLAESAEESETEDVPEKLAASDDEHDSDEDMVVSSDKFAASQQNKHVTILSDDDDEDEEDDQPKRLVEATPKPKTRYPKSPSAPNTKSPKVPTSVLRSATKTFIPGLSTTGPAGLGLTQIFAGTMDDSQMGSAPPGSGSPSQPMPTFDVEAFPDSNFSQTAQETSSANDMILDSQPVPDTQQEAETQAVQIRFSQSQVHRLDSFLQENLDPLDPTQTSDLIEPTQDAGFQNYSPLRQRFVELPRQAPVSTVDTVKLDVSQQRQQDEEVEVEVNMSPLVKRTGKLRRKADVVAAAVAPAVTSPDVEEEQDEQDEDDVMMEGIEEDGGEAGSSAATAFDFLKLASLKEKKIKAKKEAFDKKKSKAREMVEDQAAESEDEYAGLGGVDGEGDSDDDDESVKEMIDDETKNNEVDERKLAAFHA